MHDRLRISDEYQEAWDHLCFSQRQFFQEQGQDFWTLRGDILFQFGHASVVCTQLPSKMRQVAQSTWKLTRLSGLDFTSLLRFTVGPNQDLLGMGDGGVRDFPHTTNGHVLKH